MKRSGQGGLEEAGKKVVILVSNCHLSAPCKSIPALICPSCASFPYTKLLIIKYTPYSIYRLSFKRLGCTYRLPPIPPIPLTHTHIVILAPDFRALTDFLEPSLSLRSSPHTAAMSIRTVPSRDVPSGRTLQLLKTSSETS